MGVRQGASGAVLVLCPWLLQLLLKVALFTNLRRVALFETAVCRQLYYISAFPMDPLICMTYRDTKKNKNKVGVTCRGKVQ